MFGVVLGVLAYKGEKCVIGNPFHVYYL